jgi:hypothetical protein
MRAPEPDAYAGLIGTCSAYAASKGIRNARNKRKGPYSQHGLPALRKLPKLGARIPLYAASFVYSPRLRSMEKIS